MSRIPNGTGLFNLMRQLGGSVGIALSATLIQRLPQFIAPISPQHHAVRRSHARAPHHDHQCPDRARRRPAIAQTKAIGFSMVS